jgi:hypothetical protein
MVQPKGSGSTVVDINIGDGAIGVDLVRYDPPNVAVGSRRGRVEGSHIPENPRFPAWVIVNEEFVDKPHEQAAVLKLEVLHAESPVVFCSLNTVPGN